jgi:hypothetical protein
MLIESRLRACLIAALVVGCSDAREPAPPPVEAPATAPSDEDAAQIEKMLRLAMTGSPVVRPQAAERLVGFGAPAAARLLEACGDGPAAMAPMGQSLVEALGAFDDPALRARLWDAVSDADFPWRAAATRGLTKHARADELARFDVLLADPLAAVRNAVVEAYGALDARTRMDALRARLALDPDDRVRRAAAALLDTWQERDALWWLFEDLRRSDTFFDAPTGRMARFKSAQVLAQRAGDLHGYDSSREPTDPANVDALRELEETLEELAGTPMPPLPAMARAGPAGTRDLLGLELLSCRRGEHALRWTADDLLLVGQGNPAVLQLPPGTSKRLLAEARARLDEVGEQLFWGAPGCDMEQLHVRVPGEDGTRTLILSKGPETVAGLRPAPLGALARALVATLPDGPSPDPRLERLATHVRETLVALGGPLGE